MKKVKQVLAILLILILIGLYVSTLVFAIIGSERAMVWLKISIYATIVLPVLLWAYGFIYKMIKDDNEKKGDVYKRQPLTFAKTTVVIIAAITPP